MVEKVPCDLRRLSPEQILCIPHQAAFRSDPETLRIHARKQGIEFGI